MVDVEENTVETISWQLAMAFGQGAGTSHATPAALGAALEPYRQYLQEHLSEWNSVALTFIEFSRALGRLSAARAAQQGQAVIDTPHVAWALPIIQNNNLWPLGACHCLVAPSNG